jgi:hypothetical protein
MELPRVTRVDVNQESVVVDNDRAFKQYNFFLPLNQFACIGLPWGRRIGTNVPSINPMHPGSSEICVARCNRSAAVGHLISSEAATFTQLAIKRSSSLAEVLLQFHRADSKETQLSCLRFATKRSKRCSGASFGGLPELAHGRHVIRAVDTITGQTLKIA